MFSLMIPASDYDRLKSRVYNLVFGENHAADFSEVIRMYKARYEQETHSEDPFKLLRKNNTLEEELFVFAYSFVNSHDKHKEKIDSRAFKRITKDANCIRNRALARHYRKVYQEMKRGLMDFMEGRVYIEDCEEDGTSGAELDDYLELELHRLAMEHKRTRERKKRAVDIKAYKLIRASEGCKNNHFLIRYYYGIYRDLTKPKKEGGEEAGKESANS